MSEFDGNLHGVITVAMMATFIGIWVWAWRKRHKNVFDRMAGIPMEDELSGSVRNDENKGNSL
ncbi:MAG: cytochrome c oxidase subunit [Pseudomonadota bacterium]|jgi:cytochrome c oxidase cbb3-type subunit 4